MSFYIVTDRRICDLPEDETCVGVRVLSLAKEDTCLGTLANFRVDDDGAAIDIIWDNGNYSPGFNMAVLVNWVVEEW